MEKRIGVKPGSESGLKIVKRGYLKREKRPLYKKRVNCFDAIDDRSDYFERNIIDKDI